MCQGEYAHARNLKECDVQGQKKICFHHLYCYYHIDSLYVQQIKLPTKQMIIDSEVNCTITKEPSILLSQLNNANNRNPPKKIQTDDIKTAESFKTEWAKSMNLPISHISKRFNELELSGHEVNVEERCSEGIRKGFHKVLRTIDDKYDPTICKSSRLKEMPILKEYLDNHIIMTPYSISIQKCGEASCTTCTPFKSSEQNRDLVLQRQPTPQNKTKEHFYSRDEALSQFKGQKNALTNLDCLPSKATK